MFFSLCASQVAVQSFEGCIFHLAQEVYCITECTTSLVQTLLSSTIFPSPQVDWGGGEVDMGGGGGHF